MRFDMDLPASLRQSAVILAPQKTIPSEYASSDLVFYVVGNKFHSFSDNNTVLTLDEAIEHIDIIARIANRVILGQGLSCTESIKFQDLLNQQNSTRTISVTDTCLMRIDNKLVQKRNPSNVLIGHPRKMDDTDYVSELLIDDDCAEMADDDMGQHINGVLLMEAARQMFIACVLTNNLSPDFAAKAGQMKFTLSKIDIRFDNFLFPMAAELRLRFGEIKIHGESAQGAAVVQFYQFDRKCCEIAFQATAFSEKAFASLENRCALKARRKISQL